MARTNPLLTLESFGQAIWLDFIRRTMLVSGDFRQLLAQDGVTGFTSNPSIFDKVIAGSHDYDEAIGALALDGTTAEEIYEDLALVDVRMGADALLPTYRRLGGKDGCASMEVSPRLAYDADQTVAEAERLFRLIGRPNALVKVPATEPGVEAIRRLIAAGVNVNVTLLFGLGRYREVAEAYIAGLEERLRAGEPVDRIISVASFFLSRIDVMVDPMLEDITTKGGEAGARAQEIRGETAIASAKIAYRIYQEIFGGDRFKALADRGARPQRLLWASTSTKDPSYSDVKYVEALIGPETVNTLPLETLQAYRDHGQPEIRLTAGVDNAEAVLRSLADLGIDIDDVTTALEREGVEKFDRALDSLLKAVRSRKLRALREPLEPQAAFLGQYASAIDGRLKTLETERFSRRLWAKDASLWVTDPAASQSVVQGLGWLDLPEKMLEHIPELKRFAVTVREGKFKQVVHIGMGGSSLAPLLFSRMFERSDDGLPLTILDTTDPVTIERVEADNPPESTLYIIASKSGGTAETIALRDYFLDRVRDTHGERAGESFVAITDPGSPLERFAHDAGFRRCFLNFSDVGGRYSALSFFGLLPAVLMGIDANAVLERAARIRHACTASVPLRRNPGVALGSVMGELARQGRDKVTFLTPAPLEPLGMWLEQLLAESTGKQGRGLLPVVGEPVVSAEDYSADRQFVLLTIESHPDPELDRLAASLEEQGHPVITVSLEDPLDVGDLFYRFEMATATAGSIIGINAFDQPNVQESKDATKQMLEKVNSGGALAPLPAVRSDRGFVVPDAEDEDPDEVFGRFFDQARAGDYVAVMAYLTEEADTDQELTALRARLLEATGFATTLGYGPRFLHSTGQYHKGGPNTGLFIQLTAEDTTDLAIPGRSYGFATFRRAQALGDFDVLRHHGRRVVRVHLGTDLPTALAHLTATLREAAGAAAR